MFTFIESSIFERICPAYLDDDEYSELQQFLIQNPKVGELIPGSGGVRKLRWARAGMGKRGGLRIVYYVRFKPHEFWMLTIYAKAKQENIPAHILKQLLEAFRDGYKSLLERRWLSFRPSVTCGTKSWTVYARSKPAGESERRLKRNRISFVCG